MTTFKYLIVAILFLALHSCNLRETARKAENLPPATGESSSILVVADSTMWQGELGDVLRNVFKAPIAALPQAEPLFDMQHVEPFYFKGLLKRQKNIMFVTVLDDDSRANRVLRTYFTEESLQQIKEDPSVFMYVKENEFAKGQHILHLFGSSEEELMQNVLLHKQELQNHWIKIARQHVADNLYNPPVERGIMQAMQKKFGASLKVPYGYEVAVEEESFMWLRQLSLEIDKNIVVSYIDYSDESQFSLDSLLAIRERVLKPYVLYRPEDPESYMLTETEHFEVERREVNFNGHFGVRLQGLWKLNKYTMGGTFIGYALVDETNNRLYYIEGFLYSPGRDKRDSMLELDVALNTFDFSESAAD